MEKMVKEQKEQQVVEQPQGKTLQESTIEELKVLAFDIEQQIKTMQRNYNVILQELQVRMEKTEKPQETK